MKPENLHENVNLSVGRLIDVTVGQDPCTSLKVQIHLSVLPAPEATIVSILNNGVADQSWSDFYHGYMSGRLKFWRDGVLCQHLIDEKMKMAVEDKTGIGAEIYARVANNRRYGILSNNPSANTASNIFIMSEETAAKVAYKVGGKLSDYASRQKVFDVSYAMILVVISRDTGRCTFYVRGQPEYSTLSRKDIEMSAKGKGPDVMEIFRSLQSASFSNF